MSDEGEEVEEYGLDTMVNMSTTALTVPWGSTLTMSSVRFVEAKRKEPVFDVVLGDSFDVVVGNLANWELQISILGEPGYLV